MFGEERKIKIAEIVGGSSSVRVSELARTFAVSESTIRRDLIELQKSGLLLRTHGGAMSGHTGFEPSFVEQESAYIQEKEAIGKKAAEFIRDGDTILLDSGTTITYIPRYIMAKGVTIVTNSLPLLWELSKYDHFELIVLGGAVRKKTKMAVGPLAELSIRQFHVDKVFLGANGVSLREGVTTPDMTEANVKKAMLSVAREKFLVADSSKFGVVTFSAVCALSEIDCIITDQNLPPETAEEYRNGGVKLETSLDKGPSATL